MGKNEVDELQKELKVLKNEIKGALLDIREYLLTNVENPFPVDMAAGRPQAKANENAAEPARPPATAAPAAAAPLPQAPQVTQAPQPVATFGAIAGPAMMGNYPMATGDMPFVVNRTPNKPAEVIQSGLGAGAAESVEKKDDQPRDGDAPGPGSAPAAQKNEPGKKTSRDQLEQLVEIRPRGGKKDMDDLQKKLNLPKNGHNGNGNGKSGTDKAGTDLLDRLASAETNESEIETAEQNSAELDLITVTLLASWVETSLSKVGRERLKVVVDVYASMGKLGQQLKEVLHKLISLANNGVTTDNVTVRDCLQVLMDLDHVVWRSGDKTNAALLSLFQSK